MTWPLAAVLIACAFAFAGAYCFRRYVEMENSRQHTHRTISNNVRAASERMARALQDSKDIFNGAKADNIAPLTPERAATLFNEPVIVPFGKRKTDEQPSGGDVA